MHCNMRGKPEFLPKTLNEDDNIQCLNSAYYYYSSPDPLVIYVVVSFDIITIYLIVT